MAMQRVADLDGVAVGAAVEARVSDGADGDVELALVRTGDDVVKAVHNVCSHQRYPLAEGWVDADDNTIECALHGSAFDLDTGEPQSLPASRAVPVYACAVRDGGIWVDVDAQTNDAPVPDHA